MNIVYNQQVINKRYFRYQGKNGDYDYNIVEEIDCENKYELHNRERYYIENNECINKKVPKQTVREWYKKMIDENPNYHKEQYKRYGGKLRNDLKRRTCECGGKYIQRNLKIHLATAKHKKYVGNI